MLLSFVTFDDAGAGASVLRTFRFAIVIVSPALLHVLVGPDTAVVMAVIALVPGFLTVVTGLSAFVVELAHVAVAGILGINDAAARLV